MNHKSLCAIVDDEPTAIGRMEQLLGDLDLLKIERTYINPDRFLAEVRELKSEIIFLDMEMSISGHEVAGMLENKKVIFVSGHEEKAHHAFDVEAVDFIKKPVKLHRLRKAIEKALNQIPEPYVVLKTDEANKHVVYIEDIVKIIPGVDSRDKKLFLLSRMNDPLVVKNQKFEFLLEKINHPEFIQVNKKMVINTRFVTKVISADLIGLQVVDHKDEVTLSDSFKEEFFRARPEFR